MPSPEVRRSHRLFYLVSAVFAGVGLAGAWLIVAGVPEETGAFATFVRFLVSRWMLLTFAVAGGLMAYAFWYLRTSTSRASRTGDPDAAMRRQTVPLALAFSAVALALTAIGYLFVRDIDRTFREERFDQQAAIARLKAQQVDEWLFKGGIQTELLGKALQALPLERLPADPDVKQLVGLVCAEFLARNPEGVAVSLFAGDGRLLYFVGEGSAPDRETTKAALEAAAAPGRLRLIDLHSDREKPPQPRMGFVAAVPPSAGFKSAVVAVTIDPSRSFFAQVQAWPTSSETSEVLLVDRRGDDVVFLTPPQGITPTPPPLSFRLPLSRTGLPAAEAILRGDGVREGVDYRGVQVLTASHHVTGLPWFVVAKTDVEEAMRPLRRQVRVIVLVVSAAVVLAGVMVAALWRAQREAFVHFRDRQLEEQRAQLQHFAQLVQLSRDIVLLTGPEGNIVDANEVAVAAYGYSRDELRALNIRDLQAGEPSGVDRRQAEALHRRKDGTTFPVEITGRAVDIDGKRYRQRFVRDVSIRKAQEKALARLSGVMQAVQAATSVLLRAATETEIYEQVCTIMIELGEYSLACVAVPNDDAARTFRVLAGAGIDQGHLDTAVAARGDGPRAGSPTDRALRIGKTQVDQNLATSPEIAPWRDEALKRDLHACIGLPLKVQGKTFGVLTLYSAEPDAFGIDEISLLDDLANDISFRVSALRAASTVAAG